MSFRCVIIDDEQYAVDVLIGYVESISNLKVHATFLKPAEALAKIKSEDDIDFIFLDIEMPGISGLDLARSLRDKTRYLIFTTGHNAHAITAFDVKANHYLLKPITFSKFAFTIAELLEKDNKNPHAEEIARSKIHFVKGDQKNAYNCINTEAIMYIEAAKNYVIIHMVDNNEQFVTHMGLNHIEQALDPKNFIRISKSYIIAKNAIKKVDGNVIKTKNGKPLQLGVVYKPKFQIFLNEHLLKN